MRKGLGISLENCEKQAATRDHVHMLEFGLCLVYSHFVPPGIKVRCTVRHCRVHVHVHVTEDVLYVIFGMVTLLYVHVHVTTLPLYVHILTQLHPLMLICCMSL